MAALGDPATVVLMHPAKGATRDSLQPRGGGAFSGSIDGELCAWNEDGLIEFFHRQKFRGPGFDPMFFRLQRLELPEIVDNFGEPAVSVVAVPTDAKPQAKARPPLSGANRVALDALRACYGDGAIEPTEAVLAGIMKCGGQPLFPPSAVVPEAAWRDRCYKMAISDGEQPAKATAFRRAHKSLLDLGLVQTFDGHYWLPEWRRYA